MTTTVRIHLLAALLALAAACSAGKDGATSAAGYTLIDDMEGTGNVIAWVPPGGATAGGWWTATDCTQIDRIAPPPVDIDPNGWSYDLLPEAHETFAGVTSLHAARLRTTTPLVGTWGAMMGMNFLPGPLLDGGVRDPSSGCLGAFDYEGTTVDLSAYSGVTFWAMAAPGLRSVRVSLRDHNTDPRGGFCNAGNPTTDGDCYNDFGTDVVLSDTFTQYTIDFSSLLQRPGWGVRPDPNAPDLQHVYLMIFGVNLPCPEDESSMCAGGNMQGFSFDFRIDDLYFVNRAP